MSVIKLSVIIPSRNRPNALKRCLDSLNKERSFLFDYYSCKTILVFAFLCYQNITLILSFYNVVSDKNFVQLFILSPFSTLGNFTIPPTLPCNSK